MKKDTTRVRRSIEDKIVLWRSRSGHTIQELCDLLDISRSALDDKRAGRTSYLDSEILTLCEVFEITPNELLDYPTN